MQGVHVRIIGEPIPRVRTALSRSLEPKNLKWT